MKAVEFKNFNWKYPDAAEFALTDINLEIEENQFIGIIGPNEAGKTTLISAIKGIIPENFNGVYKGEVSVFGKKVTDSRPIEMAQKVGMVFADPDAQFNSMSVEEELAFGMENVGCTVEEIGERLKWVSELVKVGDLMDKPPYNLSGGQKQRVAVASVLAVRPKIIIMDEPTSMLDPISKDMIFDLLRTMKEELKLTIIVVEHNIEKLSELCDKMILVNNGHIEKYCDTAEMFDDLDFLEERNISVPGAIKLMHMVNKERNVTGRAPIHFEEIEKTMREYMKGGC